MIQSELHVYGIVTARLFRGGQLIQEDIQHNVTCNAGVAALAATAVGAGNTFFGYIAVGTGTVTPAVTDTALTAEVMRLASSSFTQVTTNTPNDTAQLVVSYGVFVSNTITEAGLLSASSGGSLLGHVLIGPFSVLGGDVLQITWNEVF